MTDRTGSAPTTGVSDVPARFADDTFYRALGAQRRRRSLAYVLTNEHCSVDELVDVLAGWETVGTEMVPDNCFDLLKVELYHVHLPILEEAGLIEYDEETGKISIEPLADPVKEFIHKSVEAEHS